MPPPQKKEQKNQLKCHTTLLSTHIQRIVIPLLWITTVDLNKSVKAQSLIQQVYQVLQ